MKKNKNKINKNIILMYHKVANDCFNSIPALSIYEFRKQINLIKRFYEIVPIEEIFNPGNKRTRVALTFDDGYRCVYKYAYPILKKLNIPATIFLAVDCIEKNIPVWTDLPGLPDKNLLKNVSNTDRLSVLKKIKDKICFSKTHKEMLQMCSWNEIKEMSENNITFGGHTMTHPILSKVSIEQARYEIQESKRIIENKINKPISIFAYPNGQPDDFNNEIKKILREAGYTMACTTIFGKNDSDTDPFELKRIYTSGNNVLKFIFRLMRN